MNRLSPTCCADPAHADCMPRSMLLPPAPATAAPAPNIPSRLSASRRLMPPCPRLVRGQQELTPEQEAYARQFARERIASLLSTEVIDEQEAEDQAKDRADVHGVERTYEIRAGRELEFSPDELKADGAA